MEIVKNIAERSWSWGTLIPILILIREYRIKDINTSADYQNIDIWPCLNIYINICCGILGVEKLLGRDSLLTLQQCFGPQQRHVKTMS